MIGGKFLKVLEVLAHALQHALQHSGVHDESVCAAKNSKNKQGTHAAYVAVSVLLLLNILRKPRSIDRPTDRCLQPDRQYAPSCA